LVQLPWNNNLEKRDKVKADLVYSSKQEDTTEPGNQFAPSANLTNHFTGKRFEKSSTVEKVLKTQDNPLS